MRATERGARSWVLAGDAVREVSGLKEETRSTWELLRNDYVAEPLGPVDVKGKGPVETWRLVGPRGG